MARLFITPRELSFISDITKELIKDVCGQFIYYYPISEFKTQAHGVYNESLRKVFDNPIKIECLVDAQKVVETKTNSFTVDAQYEIEVYVQYRDLIEKGINVNIGDFMSFGDVFYEITDRVYEGRIYGLPEHKRTVKLTGVKARDGQFTALTIGPTDISRPEADAVQTTFVQQRGVSENKEGVTADRRDLVANGTLDPPIDGPSEVTPDGTSSSFYDEK